MVKAIKPMQDSSNRKGSEEGFGSDIPSRVSSMNKFQKLAALLVILGPENAAGVLKSLADSTVESVVAEISNMRLLSADEQEDILKEFAGLISHASSSLSGGMNIAKETLERSVGHFKAANVLGRISPTPSTSDSLSHLLDMEPRQLFNLIKSEQDQTIALILSYFPADRAADISARLSEDKRVKVLERLATLSPTPADIVEKVVCVVLAKAKRVVPQTISHSGGLRAAAAMLNAMDKTASQGILSILEEKNADLGAAIKQKMFTFEDFIHLDAQDVQKILRDVDMRDLAMALKGASEALTNFILSCMSKRAAESVSEEIEFLTSTKPKEIEGSQLRIIESARRLETDEEIDLSNVRGGGS